MQQITQFDQSTSVRFKQAIEKRLEEIGDEFGVSMKIDKVSMMGRGSMNMTLTSSIGSEVKLEDTPSGRMFHEYCGMYQIPKDALGKTIRVNGTLYRLVGWAPNARKYCVEGERISDGKIFRLPGSLVRSHLT